MKQDNWNARRSKIIVSNKRRRMQINALARNRENPKSEKSQTLFSLAWVDRVCILISPALKIIENGAVDQNLWGF